MIFFLLVIHHSLPLSRQFFTSKLPYFYFIFSLTAGAAPSILIEIQNAMVAEGQTGMFMCKISGSPKPKVSW